MKPGKERVKWDLSSWPGLTIAVLIVILQAEGNSVTEEHRCYWCGPLAEQVHRSARAQPCHHPLRMNATCEPGLRYCATVATVHPYRESRLCVKIYQEECYPLHCNTTNTWKMVCPCRGEYCNGPNTEREIEAFGVLIKLAAKSSRSKSYKRSAEGVVAAQSNVLENYDEIPGHAFDNTDHVVFNENFGTASLATAENNGIHVSRIPATTIHAYSETVKVGGGSQFLGSTTDGDVPDPKAAEPDVKIEDFPNEIPPPTDASESEMVYDGDTPPLAHDKNDVERTEIEHPPSFAPNEILIEESDLKNENIHSNKNVGGFPKNESDGIAKNGTSKYMTQESDEEMKNGQDIIHNGRENNVERTDKGIDFGPTSGMDEYDINNQRDHMYIESENELRVDRKIPSKKTMGELPTAQALLQNTSPVSKDNEIPSKPTDMTSLSVKDTTTQAIEASTMPARGNRAERVVCSTILFLLVGSIGTSFMM